MAASIPLAVVNVSTVVSDADAADACTAFQVGLDRDFAPVWRQSREIQFFTKNDAVAVDVDRVYIVDRTNQPGALGFHDDEKGHAVGYVGAGDDLQAGQPWESTLFHEGYELIGDRLINRTQLHLGGTGLFGRQTAELLAIENCDACEAINYTIPGKSGKGWHASDFVCEEWFTGDTSPWPHGGYSFSGQVKAPLQILPGGYIGVLPVRVIGQWGQVTADLAPPRAAHWECYQHKHGMLQPIIPPLLSRRRRRMGRVHC